MFLPVNLSAIQPYLCTLTRDVIDIAAPSYDIDTQWTNIDVE